MMSACTRPPFLALFSCIAALTLTTWCERAEAAVVLEATGFSFRSNGIGNGNGQQAGAIGFSTDRRLEDVVFTVPLTHVGFGTANTVNAYLTDSIGPGTTAGDNLLSQTSFPVGVGEAGEFEVLTFPALDPGTYYLMLIDFGTNSVGWDAVSTSTVILNSVDGVQLVSSLAYAQTSGPFPPAYAPLGDTRSASIFPGVLAFRIDATVIPEPSTIGLLMVGGLLLATRPIRSSVSCGR